MEHRRVRRVVVVAIHASRADDADRRLVRLHVADLHGRGLRAQDLVRIRDVERVLHAARRMVREHPQRREVVVVVLDLRSVGGREPHRREEALGVFLRARDRVQPSARLAAPGERHVDRLEREPRVELARAQLIELRLHELLHLALRIVDRGTRLRTLAGGKLSERFQLPGQYPGLAEEARLRLVELSHRGRRGDGRACLFDNLFEFAHGNKKGLLRAPVFSLRRFSHRGSPWLVRRCAQMRACRTRPGRRGPCDRCRWRPS